MSEFKERGAEVVAISTDSKFSHKTWLETPRNKGGIEGCKLQLLSDFTKKTSTDYGVLHEGMGLAFRGLFLIDPDGVVQAIQVNNLPVGRNEREVLRLIDAFREHKEHGVVCQMSWTKGAEAIDPAKAAEWFAKHGVG